MPYAITISLLLVVVSAWLYRRARRRQRRADLRQADFPQSWIMILKTSVPIYDDLPAALQQELHGHIHVFLDEKTFVGCGGLEINDEIRIVVAAQACMLLLNNPQREYKTLKTIMIYPSTYSSETTDVHGHESEQHRLGESWVYGPVVLAWDAVKHGASDINDGRNVVFHEFAHQLDQADGEADGAPDLGARSRYLAWARVLSAEFDTLQKRAREGDRHIMDRYGATNPAEFFAVATETFYEKPRQMKKKHPELYAELKNFYKCDPLSWRKK